LIAALIASGVPLATPALVPPKLARKLLRATLVTRQIRGLRFLG
jgi:hypothetical protein